MRRIRADAATVLDGWIWDTELKGFGLRVRSPDHKTYVLEYRPGSGGRGSPMMASAIRLLLLTGCRKSEILSLR